MQTLAVNTDDATTAGWQSGTEPAPWSDASPGAPTLTNAKAYDGAASIAWLPGDTGSSAVTGYQVLAEPGDIATVVGGDTTQATVTGLTDGTAYTFSVTATNAIGVGAPSTVSAALTPTPSLGAVPAVSTNRPQRRTTRPTACAVEPGAQHSLEADAAGERRDAGGGSSP